MNKNETIVKLTHGQFRMFCVHSVLTFDCDSGPGVVRCDKNDELGVRQCQTIL